MAQTVVLEFKLNGVSESIQNLNDLQDAIEKLEADMSSMDLGSEAFENQKNQIDKLKDKYKELSKSGIQSAKEQADAAKKGATEAAKVQKEKFQQMGDSLEKFAKGITDALGGLFIAFGASEDSAEELQKTLAQGIGIATGVKGAIEGITSGMELWNSIGPQVVAGMQKLWAVMMANPIIAVIAVIAALVTALIAFSDTNKEVKKSQKELNEEQEKSIELMSKQIDVSEKLRAENLKQIESGDIISTSKQKSLNQLERELALLKAKGASNKEIFTAEQEIANKKLFNLKVQAKSYDLDTNTQAGLSKTLDLKKQIEDAENQIEINRVEFANKEKERLKKQAEDYKKALDEKFQKERERYLREEERKANEEAANESAIASLKEFDDARLLEIKRAKDIEVRIAAQAEADKIAAALKSYEEEQRLEAERKKRLQQRLQDFQKYNSVAINIEMALNDLIQQGFQNRLKNESLTQKERLKIQKKAFNTNKAFQLASAVQSGANAVLSALSTPPGPPATIPLGILAGTLSALQIAKIASTKFEGESGGADSSAGTSGGLASVGSVNSAVSNAGPAAPNLNLFATGGNNINTVTPYGNNGTTVPGIIKAYVVESEITDSQKKIMSIQDRSTL